jgi:acetyl esterase/lipase
MHKEKLLFLLLFLLACTHKRQYELPANRDTAISIKNIVYGVNDSQQNMDVYLPKKRDVQNTPVVIMIHGGSWITGSKSDFNGLGLDSFFGAKGCAMVNMNYRLDVTYRNAAPLQLEDIGLVMEYIKIKAAAWQINPNRVCLFGRSSGAQMALLYAYSKNQDGRIKTVIDGFGPTNLVDSSVVHTALGLNVTYLLGSYISNAQLWYDASPIFYMAGALPTVIFQGTEDQLVLPIQSKMLHDSLEIRSVPNLLFDWVGNGHGWDQSKWLQCREPAWAFAQQYL